MVVKNRSSKISYEYLKISPNPKFLHSFPQIFVSNFSKMSTNILPLSKNNFPHFPYISETFPAYLHFWPWFPKNFQLLQNFSIIQHFFTVFSKYHRSSNIPLKLPRCLFMILKIFLLLIWKKFSEILLRFHKNLIEIFGNFYKIKAVTILTKPDMTLNDPYWINWKVYFFLHYLGQQYLSFHIWFFWDPFRTFSNLNRKWFFLIHDGEPDGNVSEPLRCTVFEFQLIFVQKWSPEQLKMESPEFWRQIRIRRPQKPP